MERLAIIGFGCAGFQALKALRESGCRAEIDIYNDSAWPPYNPMLTTYYVKGKIPFQALFPFGNLDVIQSRYPATLHGETPVTAVAAKERRLRLGSREAGPYDRILITTGARALLPPIEGLPGERLFSMRSVEDAVRLKEALDGRALKKILVIGASMVGIKIVELLLEQGVAVIFSDLAEHIFPTAAFETTGRKIEAQLRRKGLELRFGVSAQKAVEREGGYDISLSDDSVVTADAVVMCIGTRAATEMVDPAEIVVKRGIVVDERMRTSAEGIYAAGDCCEGPDLGLGATRIIGLWANAAQQGTAAGLNMAGLERRYAGNILHNITHFMETDFISFGDKSQPGQRRVFLEKGDQYVEATIDNERIVCLNILNLFKNSGAIKNFLMRRLAEPDQPLDPQMEAALLKSGLPRELTAMLRAADRKNNDSYFSS